jgi:hypothetical protein
VLGSLAEAFANFAAERRHPVETIPGRSNQALDVSLIIREIAPVGTGTLFACLLTRFLRL